MLGKKSEILRFSSRMQFGCLAAWNFAWKGKFQVEGLYVG